MTITLIRVSGLWAARFRFGNHSRMYSTRAELIAALEAGNWS